MTLTRTATMRTARWVLATVGLVWFGTAELAARTVAVGPANSIEVPDDWRSAAVPNGAEVATPDGQTRIRITLGAGTNAAIQAMVEEQEDHLASQGVTVTGVVAERQLQQSGLRYLTNELAATRNGAQTIVNLLIVGMPGRPDRAGAITMWMQDIDTARRDMGRIEPVMDSLFASLARR